MLFAPFYFRLQRLLPSGLKPSPLLPTFSTCYPPKHSTLQHHTSSSSAPRRHTTTSGSLGVRATPTCPPPLPTTCTTPRSALCVFLGYFAHHKGYRCLDLATNKVIISRHVIFDEASFPFAEQHSQPVSPPSLSLSSIPSLSPRRILSFWTALTLCRLLLDRHNPL